MAHEVLVERVYDDPEGARGQHRVLVDRLWPRGVRKDELRFDEWARDLAPSTALRRWYGHDPERFDEFRRRYLAELRSADVARLRNGRGPLVLLTATSDVAHSGAAVLAEYLRRG